MELSIISLLLFWMILLCLDNSIVLGLLPSSTPLIAFNNYLFFLLFLLPLVGIVTDVWIARKKLILACFYLSMITATLLAIYQIVKYSLPHYTMSTVYSSILTVIFSLGFTAVRANIILYYIEVLVIRGASSRELSSVIYKHFLTIISPVLVYHLFYCVLTRYHFDKAIIVQVAIIFIIDGVFIASHIILRKIFQGPREVNKLNPVKLVVRVLCYAKKHKYPESRSALTYWEDKAPSRLDLGKEKFGGPFKEEEVEDVKTAFRIAPLLICVFGYATSMEIFDNSKYIKEEDSLCLFQFYVIRFIISIIYIVLYKFLLHWNCNHFLSSMLKRITTGLVLLFLSCVSFAAIEAVAYLKSNVYNETEFINNETVTADNASVIPIFSSYWTIPPYILYAISYSLVFITSLEFVIAQSPYHMRGLLVGLWYVNVSLGLLVGENLNFIYTKYLTDSKPNPQFYLYLTRSIILTIVIIGFSFLVKHYKLRIKKKDINVYSVISEVYGKYLEQEEEHKKHMYEQLQ
uniref:Major facilitator superfamily associated domain-containing protein n=1 Tax=Amphimedon queenslandica TaxID=400682 RepID=A0A1X7U2N1_AMPQE